MTARRVGLQKLVIHFHSGFVAVCLLQQLQLIRGTTGTACWPCRQRKVKCDNKSPCENCVKREHPQLCSYKPNRTTNPTLKQGSVVSEPSHGLKRQHSPDDHGSRSQSVETRNATNIRAYGMYMPCTVEDDLLTLTSQNLRRRTRRDTWGRTVFRLY